MTLWLFSAAFALTACHGSSVTSDVDAAPAPPPASVVEAEPLAVPGHLDAVVSPAQGEARPLVVAAHGAWDRPEWHCAMWRRVTRGRAFVLCPRGEPTNPTAPETDRAFYYRDHLHLQAEVLAAISALAARYGDRVDPAHPIYAGFSQGSIQGAVMLRANPAHFARAVLVEGGYGGYHEWGPQAADGFRRGGGARVLLACGREECARTAESTRATLERAQIDAKIVYVPGVGHTYGDGMEDRLRESFFWVVEGDQRWRGDE